MRQKQLVQNRLRKLQGQLKKLDMNIHRGGSRTTINEYGINSRTNSIKLGKIYRLY